MDETEKRRDVMLSQVQSGLDIHFFPLCSTTAEIYMQAHEHTANSATLHPPKVWGQFVDDVYFVLKFMHLENFFHHINNLRQNIKITMEEKGSGKLVFLDTFFK